MLEITQTPDQEILKITLKGDITSASAVQFEQALAASFAGAKAPRWLFDLSGLSFTSSAGLRVFLSYAKKIKNAGGRLVLLNAQAAVYEVFDVSGFTKILTFSKDPAEARTLLTKV